MAGAELKINKMEAWKGLRAIVAMPVHKRHWQQYLSKNGRTAAVPKESTAGMERRNEMCGNKNENKKNGNKKKRTP